MKKYFTVSFYALIALACGACATFTPSPDTEGTRVSIRGAIVAYGSEPHLTLMIRAEDGKLYYPEGDLQRRIVGLPAALYLWTGVLFPPRPVLVGFLPAHTGRFTTLEWTRVD